MKFNQMRDVVAIAERGSLRAAARHLRLAQPALTRSVHELERELGAPLFERRARGMALTPVGQAFVRRAAVVLSEVKRARDEVEQLNGGTQGRVVVGLSTAGLVALLPKALQPFRARYPNVELHVMEGWYPTMEASLSDGSVDLYVGPEPERPPRSELVQEKLFDNFRIILGRKGHPLAQAKSLRDLVDAEWATTSVTFQAEEEMGQLFAQHNLRAPRLALRSQSAVTLMVTLTNTDLLAMVPVQWSTFMATNSAIAPILVRETLPAPAMVTVRRAGLPLTPAAEHFLDLLRRAIPKQQPKQKSR
ncbi:LysR substrate-binding domain-containing protein [Bradyrhizobium sp. WSM3983]|uniref:LysR substrate-binding domain-containing protein n=1 Tax=Bradyrhizobium sp. WSM3983 TaxID=1038867 RepID=UPI0004166DB9|nr:LysR substrate-binding domain-containing protein [Bradyrhizobium sp. WSM3983]